MLVKIGRYLKSLLHPTPVDGIVWIHVAKKQSIDQHRDVEFCQYFPIVQSIPMKNFYRILSMPNFISTSSFRQSACPPTD